MKELTKEVFANMMKEVLEIIPKTHIAISIWRNKDGSYSEGYTITGDTPLMTGRGGVKMFLKEIPVEFVEFTLNGKPVSNENVLKHLGIE